MNDWGKDYLAHHGILGMKWGIRRYQNEDGSLTKAGKDRYSVSKEKLKSDAKALIGDRGTYSFDAHSAQIDKLSSELATDYDDYYKSLKSDTKFKERVMSKLHADFGDGCDDPDYFEMVADEHIADVCNEMLPKTISKKREELFREIDSYYDEAKDVSKKLLEKYGEKTLVDSPYGVKELGDVALAFVTAQLKDAAFNAYVYKHFDDYWVYDVDSRYALSDLFSVDEYNQKFGGAKHSAINYRYGRGDKR